MENSFSDNQDNKVLQELYDNNIKTKYVLKGVELYKLFSFFQNNYDEFKINRTEKLKNYLNKNRFLWSVFDNKETINILKDFTRYNILYNYPAFLYKLLEIYKKEILNSISDSRLSIEFQCLCYVFILELFLYITIHNKNLNKINITDNSESNNLNNSNETNSILEFNIDNSGTNININEIEKKDIILNNINNINSSIPKGFDINIFCDFLYNLNITYYDEEDNYLICQNFDIFLSKHNFDKKYFSKTIKILDKADILLFERKINEDNNNNNNIIINYINENNININDNNNNNNDNNIDLNNELEDGFSYHKTIFHEAKILNNENKINSLIQENNNLYCELENQKNNCFILNNNNITLNQKINEFNIILNKIVDDNKQFAERNIYLNNELNNLQNKNIQYQNELNILQNKNIQYQNELNYYKQIISQQQNYFIQNNQNTNSYQSLNTCLNTNYDNNNDNYQKRQKIDNNSNYYQR